MLRMTDVLENKTPLHPLGAEANDNIRGSTLLAVKRPPLDAGNGASRRALTDKCPSSALLPGGGAICRHCGDFQPVIAALFCAGGKTRPVHRISQYRIIIFRSKPVVKGNFSLIPVWQGR